MADEKLGTSATYSDPLKSGQPIRMRGVTFAPNEAVDLKELMPEEQAKAFAKKLAGNPSFQVEGGPDHAKLREAQQRHEDEAREQEAEHQQRARHQPPEQATLENDTPRAPKRR